MSMHNSSTRISSDEIKRPDRARNEEGFLLVPGVPDDDDFASRLNDLAWAASIKGYVLTEKIGSGGTSNVYLAECESSNQPVAIKLFNRSIRDTTSRVRFNREIHALKTLDHPNIARLKDCGVTADRHPYIVFDFIDGGRIDEYCQDRDLPIRDRVRLMTRICDALQHAHNLGIVHRDLKPGNIIVGKDGTPFLTDFGLSKLFDDDNPEAEKTRTGAVLGTLNYLAPEQLFASKKRPSSKTDVFGLGAVLHVLLTGKPPLEFENVVEAATTYFGKLPTRLDSDEIPVDLEAICIKCLAADPDDRYPSAKAVKQDLTRFLNGKPVLAKRPTFRQKYSLFSKQYPHLALGIPMAFVGIAVFSLVVLGLWRQSEHNFQQANESRLQLLQNMDELSDDVRSLEDFPETLAVRINMLRTICETYADQQPYFGGSPELLFKSAVADFKLADLEQAAGEQDSAIRSWGNALKKFSVLVYQNPKHEEARFGMFQSLLWLHELDQALDEIESLLADFPNNPDYLDALATAARQLGEVHFRKREYAKSKVYFEKAHVAADLLPMIDPDGRFTRKRAQTNINLARFAILDNEMEKASRLATKASKMYRFLKPQQFSTHGESHEYMVCLRFGMSISAFTGDILSTERQFFEASRFFSETRKRFSSYEQLYEPFCRILEDYAAFCHLHDMNEEFDRTVERWNEVINDWGKLGTPSVRFHLERLVASTYPYLTNHDLEQIVSSRNNYFDREPDPVHIAVGRSWLITGELANAQRLFTKWSASHPGDIQIDRYKQLEYEQAMIGEPVAEDESTPKPIVDIATQRELLATSLSYRTSTLGSAMKEDLKHYHRLAESKPAGSE